MGSSEGEVRFFFFLTCYFFLCQQVVVRNHFWPKVVELFSSENGLASRSRSIMKLMERSASRTQSILSRIRLSRVTSVNKTETGWPYCRYMEA